MTNAEHFHTLAQFHFYSFFLYFHFGFFFILFLGWNNNFDDDESLMLLMHDHVISSSSYVYFDNPPRHPTRQRNNRFLTVTTAPLPPSSFSHGTFKSSLPIGTGTTTTTTTEHNLRRRRHVFNSREEDQFASSSSSSSSTDDERVYSSGRWQWSLRRQQLADGQRIQSRLMISPGDEPWSGNDSSSNATGGAAGGGIDVARLSHFVDSALTHTRIASSSSNNNSNHSSKVPLSTHPHPYFWPNNNNIDFKGPQTTNFTFVKSTAVNRRLGSYYYYHYTTRLSFFFPFLMTIDSTTADGVRDSTVPFFLLVQLGLVSKLANNTPTLLPAHTHTHAAVKQLL